MEAEIRGTQPEFIDLFGEESAGGTTKKPSKNQYKITKGKEKPPSLGKMRTGESVDEHTARINDQWKKDTEPKVTGLEE